MIFRLLARPEKITGFFSFFILMADSAAYHLSLQFQVKTINVIKGLVVDKVERTLYGQLSLEMRDV